MERKKEDRSLLIYLLLSIVTCGIYGAIFMWKFVKDLNEVSAAKNKESPSQVTCHAEGFSGGCSLKCVTFGVSLSVRKSGWESPSFQDSIPTSAGCRRSTGPL